MKRVEVIIIGGGQAGLAMSRCLTDRGITHAVLERGRVGERWLSERWDSGRLLSPNWQSRLPGWSYRGQDPEGYMKMADVARYLQDYACSFDAPIESGTSVVSVERDGSDYVVTTDRGTWTSSAVVVATGACGTPRIPEMSEDLSPEIEQLVPTRYRNPEQLAPGGVLIVGASASGLQLAEEIARSGRPVTLAVGHHRRAPRRYRGRDILDWMEEIGVWTQDVDDASSREIARGQLSLQLVGSPEGRELSLRTVQELGVRLTGRAIGVEGDRVHFADDLSDHMEEANRKLASLIERIEDHIAATGQESRLPAAERIEDLVAPPTPSTLDLHAEGYGTVLWATGFRPSYPWLKVPALDERGEIRHRRGIGAVPGLYVLGLPFLRRRNSHSLDGVGADAIELAEHVAGTIGRADRAAA